MDAELHRSRIDRRGKKITVEADLNPGRRACVQIGESAYVLHGDALLLWTPEFYAKKECRPHHLRVTVLTPQPILECLREG